MGDLMKFKTGIIALFLFVGLLIVPNCTFAQECESSASESFLQANLSSLMHFNSLTPVLKGGGGGSKGGSSSSKSSSSKKVKSDDDSNDNSTDDNNSGIGWLAILIIIIVVLGIIGFLVWYLVLRHR